LDNFGDLKTTSTGSAIGVNTTTHSYYVNASTCTFSGNTANVATDTATYGIAT
jgi:hypothetical protein